MKEDKLEKIIQDNRSYFDNKTPDKGIWKNISFRIGIAQRNSTSIWWKVAAVLFFGLSVYLLAEKGMVVPKNEIVQNEKFSETESFYLGAIEEKTELISQLTDNTILGEQAERDLQRLNVMYEVLKEEYKNDPSKEVTDALVLNLLLRIDILNDELEKLDDASRTAEPEVSI